MQETTPEQNLGKIVVEKTRRRVAKKVLKDISQEVEQIIETEQAEKKAARWVIYLVVALLMSIALVMFFGDDVIRSLSGWLSF